MEHNKENQLKIYTRVRQHLLSQMKQSTFTGSGACAYRGHDGCKCAIGILISDENYNHVLENVSSNGLSVKNAIKNSGYDLTGVHYAFLSELQQIHDLNEPESWKVRLDEFAKTWELKVEITDIAELFHKLWGEAHDSPDYNKQNWLKMQLLLRQNGLKV